MSAKGLVCPSGFPSWVGVEEGDVASVRVHPRYCRARPSREGREVRVPEGRPGVLRVRKGWSRDPLGLRQ